MRGRSWAPWREVAIAFAASLLVLAASLTNFLSYHSYSLFRAEVGLLLAGLVVLAAFYSLLWRMPGRVGQAAAEALLVYFAVDLNSDSGVIAALAAVAVGVLSFWTGASVHRFVAIIAGVVLLSGMVGLAETRPPITRPTSAAVSAKAAQKPAILHVILDEHGGLAGISNAQVKAAIEGLYGRHGFRMFTHAYSRHFHTVNAIPDILNFGARGESRNVAETLDIGRTAYLSNLQNKGYRLHIYQSEFADFCRYSEHVSCIRYWSPSLSFIEPLPLSAGEKSRLIAYKFAALSSALTTLADLYDLATLRPVLRDLKLPLINLKQNGLSSTVGAFAALDRLTSDLHEAKPGDAYFAHLLLPHYPYAVDADCTIRPPSEWQYRRSLRPIEIREAASHDQLLCLQTRLDRMISAFLQSSGGRGGVIVIHGDHGSRITRRDPTNWNRGRIGPSDMVAGYSTLFAVRSPQIAAGLDDRQVAAPDILASLWHGEFASLDRLKRGSGLVFLDGPNWTVGEPASINGAWPPRH